MSRWDALRRGGIQVVQWAALAKLPRIVHGFSTRPGGESTRDGNHVLNLGFAEWDERSRVTANRARFLRALGAQQMKLVALRQVHSDLIHRVDKQPEHAPRGDAAMTRTPGLLLAVQTADCVPVLLADTRRRAVATIHAGWRGTLKRIVAKTVGRMQMEFGTRPRDVVAALGPCIGRCCYEVGPEVVQAFASQFEKASEWFAATDSGPHGKMATFDSLAWGEGPNPLKWLWMTPPGHDPPPPRLKLDLVAANRRQLLDAGVPEGNISASGECTACNTQRYFSYRREGPTGRMLSVIGVK